MPSRTREDIVKDLTGRGCGPQHIEIVYFAEQVLYMLQVAAPGEMLFRQEIFNDIAKPLDTDAQGMQRDLRTATHCALVQFLSRGPALQGKMPEYRAARPNSRCAHGKREFG